MCVWDFKELLLHGFEVGEWFHGWLSDDEYDRLFNLRLTGSVYQWSVRNLKKKKKKMM